jgi:protein-S-isoprenylcysteine O-methyltransferase Ste14
MRLVLQLLANIAGMAVVFALVLFLPAGTLWWTAGWVFFGLFFAFVLALSFWLLRFNRDLLIERLTGVGRRDQKTWDKVILGMAGLGFFAWLALMALDARRYHWSRVPMWAQGLGAVLLVASFWLFYLTFRYNPYLSPAVRLQSDRAHSVIDTGPYRYVRHPMYSGFALFTVSTALLLGSWLGVIASAALVALVAVRATLEERVLRAELTGYEVYARRVRYRLIPYIW